MTAHPIDLAALQIRGGGENAVLRPQRIPPTPEEALAVGAPSLPWLVLDLGAALAHLTAQQTSRSGWWNRLCEIASLGPGLKA